MRAAIERNNRNCFIAIVIRISWTTTILVILFFVGFWIKQGIHSEPLTCVLRRYWANVVNKSIDTKCQDEKTVY